MTVHVVIRNASNNQAVMVAIVDDGTHRRSDIAVIEPGLELAIGCGPAQQLAIRAHDPLAVAAPAAA